MASTNLFPNEKPEVVRIPSHSIPGRLDKILTTLLKKYSRNLLQSLIKSGSVTVNGSTAKARQLVGPKDKVYIWKSFLEKQSVYNPEPIKFKTEAKSLSWLVVDKPAGLVTHPGSGNWGGTLLNGLLYCYPELIQVSRAGIVHRLDKNTSGLMVVARNEKAYRHLVQQLKTRTMGREYLAFVHGWLRHAGIVDRPLGRDSRVPIRMSTDRPISPKEAITHYLPKRMGESSAGDRITEVVCRLQTGRTHQIRAHMASLGHPLISDILYGGKKSFGTSRQMLHARALQFQDPNDNKKLVFLSIPPSDILHLQETTVWIPA